MNIPTELTEDKGEKSEEERVSHQKMLTERGAAYCQEQQQKNFKLYFSRW